MDPQVSRNEFIQTLMRGSMIAGMAGVGAMALHGKRTVEECFNENHCKTCWQFGGCSLPEKQEDAQ